MSEQRRFDALCFGEALVDMLPSCPGPLAEVPSFARHAGGAPANVAVGAARLGAKVAFVGSVGTDPFGEFLRTFLAHEGVDVSGVRAKSGHRTGVAFVSLSETGQPSFFSAGRGGAELALTADDVRDVPVEASSIFHLGSYVLSSESVREAAVGLLARARAADVLVALDPNLRIHLWHDVAALRQVLAELIPRSDVIKLSSDECEFVTGVREPLEAARKLVQLGPRLVIVTVGAQGCVFARSSGETGHSPSRPARVVDSTGAGDGFMGALLAGLARYRAQGVSLEALETTRLLRLLAFATEAGARVCEHVGAMAGLPTHAELGGFVLD